MTGWLLGSSEGPAPGHRHLLLHRGHHLLLHHRLVPHHALRIRGWGKYFTEKAEGKQAFWAENSWNNDHLLVKFNWIQTNFSQRLIYRFIKAFMFCKIVNPGPRCLALRQWPSPSPRGCTGPWPGWWRCLWRAPPLGASTELCWPRAGCSWWGPGRGEYFSMKWKLWNEISRK